MKAVPHKSVAHTTSTLRVVSDPRKKAGKECDSPFSQGEAQESVPDQTSMVRCSVCFYEGESHQLNEKSNRFHISQSHTYTDLSFRSPSPWGQSYGTVLHKCAVVLS